MAEDTNQGTNVERNSAGGLDEAQSRRRFLKAAVVTTAGVATAAGVVGVDMASYSTKAPSILATVFNIHSTPSRPPSASLGFEDTGLGGDCITNYGKNGNGKIENYLIFYGAELPAGTYSFTASFQVGSSSGTLTDSSLPWQLNNKNSQIHVDVVTAGSGTSCPATGTAQGTAYDSFSVSFTLASKSDVVIYMHITYVGTSDHRASRPYSPAR